MAGAGGRRTAKNGESAVARAPAPARSEETGRHRAHSARVPTGAASARRAGKSVRGCAETLNEVRDLAQRARAMTQGQPSGMRRSDHALSELTCVAGSGSRDFPSLALPKGRSSGRTMALDALAERVTPFPSQGTRQTPPLQPPCRRAVLESGQGAIRTARRGASES